MPTIDAAPTDWQTVYRKALKAVRDDPEDLEAKEWLDIAIQELNAAEEEAARDPGRIASMAAAGLQGATFGLSDEMGGLVRGAGAALMPGGKTFRQGYREGTTDARGVLRGAREHHPVASTVAEVGGSLAAPIPGMGTAGGTGARAIKAAVGRGSLRAAVRQGAATGAALGGAGALGRAEGDLGERLPWAVAGAITGGAAGAATPLAIEGAKHIPVLSPMVRGVFDRWRTGGTPLGTTIEAVKREAADLGVTLGDEDLQRIAMTRLAQRQRELLKVPRPATTKPASRSGLPPGAVLEQALKQPSRSKGSVLPYYPRGGGPRTAPAPRPLEGDLGTHIRAARVFGMRDEEIAQELLKRGVRPEEVTAALTGR